MKTTRRFLQTSVFFLSLFAGLFSCNNLSIHESEPHVAGEVRFGIADYERRTIVPTTADKENLYFTLKGAQGSDEQQCILSTTDGTSAEYMAYSDFGNAAFRLASGDWNFTLEGYKQTGDADPIVSGTQTATISPGTANSIVFNLTPVADGTGTISVTLEYDLGTDTESTVTKIEATLKAVSVNEGQTSIADTAAESDTWTEGGADNSSSISEPASGATKGSGSFTYSKSGILSGMYLLCFTVTSTNNKTSETQMGYRSDVVIVAAGCESVKTDTIELRQVYSITFENMSSDDGTTSYWADGYTPPAYYSPYEALTLPVKANTSHGSAVFDGWYKNSSCTGNEVKTIGYGTDVTSGAVTYYAKWRENIVYVSASGDNSNDGSSKGSAYATVGKAVSSLNDENLDWTICIDGALTEDISIASAEAQSITLIGCNYDDEHSTVADSITASSGTTLSVSTTIPITVTKLKLVGGSGTSLSSKNCGGALFVNTSGASVTLGTGSIVTGVTNASVARGAGVYVDNGSVTLDGGTISGNGSTSTENGGGVYVGSSGTFSVSNGTISNNAAGAGSGGGIYSEGTLSVSDTTLSSNNAATGSGGGIYSAGDLTVDGAVEISSNTAATNGGGIYSTGSLTITGESGETLDTNVVISGNEAQAGGGVYASGTTLSMTYAYVSGNSATSGNGGGVYTNCSGEATITGTNIVSNTAEGTGLGGGIYNEGSGTLTLNNLVIGKDAFTDASAANTAVCGGGVYNKCGTLTVSGGTIANNTASASDDAAGGGIYNASGAILNLSAEITGNEAANGNGGGIYSAGPFNMTGGSIASNEATNGAGVYNGSGGEFTMSAGSIADNNATTSGGGVYNAATMYMYGDAVIGDAGATTVATAVNTGSSNKATDGAGIYNTGLLQLGYKDTTTPETLSKGIYHNYASGSGAGIYSAGDSAQIIMASGSIAFNYAYVNGGGVYNGKDFVFAGGFISDNRAKSNGGGVINNNKSTMTMTGDAVIGNADVTSLAEKDAGKHSNIAASGGGIYNMDECTLTLGTAQNSLTGGIYYNYASTDGGGLFNAGVTTVNSGYIRYNGVVDPEEGETTHAGVAGKLSDTELIRNYTAGTEGNGYIQEIDDTD